MEWYVEFDEKTECWGIFNSETGFCRALFCNKQEANDFLEVT
jgi:nucleoid-associated protein YejK